jgi:hypothetical protein
MDLALHLQERAVTRQTPFSLASLQPYTKHIGAALHPAGDGALVALKKSGGLGTATMPEEKI